MWPNSVPRKHSPDELLETGIAAQYIETWIDPDPHQPMRPLLNCLAQPNESLLLFPQPGVDQGVAVRGHKPVPTDIIKPLQVFDSLRRLSADPGYVAMSGNDGLPIAQ